MKKLFYFIALILSIETYSQSSQCFFKQTNAPINIYESKSSMTPFAMIEQDSILENYYSVEILDISLKRYKVKVLSATASPSSDAFIEGWVDKNMCYVWLWEMFPDNNIFIFEKPLRNSDYVDVILDNSQNVTLPILDVKNGWYYITVINGEKSISGWTKNVCTNIWGSCEHGNPYPNTP